MCLVVELVDFLDLQLQIGVLAQKVVMFLMPIMCFILPELCAGTYVLSFFLFLFFHFFF